MNWEKEFIEMKLKFSQLEERMQKVEEQNQLHKVTLDHMIQFFLG